MNSRIVIVGGGAAGLACGMKLMKNGFSNVTILEAEDRIGGRINSTHFNNVIIDEGAQWCHGEKDNIVFEFVKDSNLLASSKCNYEDNLCYNSKGDAIDKNLTDKLHNLSINISSNYERMSAMKKIPFPNYFIETYNREIEEFVHPNDVKAMKVANEYKEFFHKFTLIYDAALNWNDISTCGLATYKICDGDPLLNWKDKGYAAFLDVLMERKNGSSILDEKIMKKRKVKKILSKGNEKVEIKCDDNELFVADHVILTISVGVLKETHKTLFSPTLPLNKINAIESMGFGVVNKILMQFPYKWWKPNVTSFVFVWRDEDRKELINDFPYGPIKNGKSWLEDICGVFVIDCDKTILLAWSVGELVKDVEEEVDEDLMKNGMMYLLKRFIGKDYETIPDIHSIRCTQWYSNDNFRGSYSYKSLEYENKNVQNDDLSGPLYDDNGKPIVQFAGEATHPYYFSTVHGAVESGFREANRIIDYYKKM